MLSRNAALGVMTLALLSTVSGCAGSLHDHHPSNADLYAEYERNAYEGEMVGAAPERYEVADDATISPQALASVDGVDNRGAVRAILEASNRTPGHADVLAVLAGHSHVDYCRLLNGIYYLMVNSASYQWVGGNHRHPSYPPEVHERAPWIDHTCPYRDPLWVVMGIDLKHRLVHIEGRTTQWVGPSPVECGADPEGGHWGWDPTYSQPRTSSWRLPLRAEGDLG